MFVCVPLCVCECVCVCMCVCVCLEGWVGGWVGVYIPDEMGIKSNTEIPSYQTGEQLPRHFEKCLPIKTFLSLESLLFT